MSFEATRGNKHDAASKFDAATKNAKDAFSSLKEAATSFGNEMTEEVQEKTKQIQDKTKHFIETRPYTAVGIAVAAGVILSWLMRK